MKVDKLKPIEPTGAPERRDPGHNPEPDLEPRPMPPDTKPAPPPIYGRPWFRRLMGAVIAVGGTLKTLPPTRYIGVGILALCQEYIDWAGLDEPKRAQWIKEIIEAIRAALTALKKFIQSINDRRSAL